ncbi:hypothetical protein WUBG_19172 [Wuchereria bancrofti]|uniref:Uncharacterized protein n=1 Tax=Wuchereria bancrofti TaxID=6293 RepID=J9DKC3_WUCBA|nr:hypothetical protein WUBG_19172 [Wuchereria bancrofti]
MSCFGKFAFQLGKVSPSISKKKKHGPPVWLRTARKRMENVPMDEVAGPSRISQESDDEGKHETDLQKNVVEGVGRNQELDKHRRTILKKMS